MVREIPEMKKQTWPQAPQALHRYAFTTPVPKGSLPHPIPSHANRAQLVQRLCGPRGAGGGQRLSRVQRIPRG